MNTEHIVNGDMGRYVGGIGYPVLVLHCRAGLGNVTAAAAIVERLDREKGVYDHPVEDFLPPAMVRADFDRYRKICDRFPFLLHVIYRMPLSYRLKYLRSGRGDTSYLDVLDRAVVSRGIRTVISTNHRGLLLAGMLKRRRGRRFPLWGVMLGYEMHSGWKYLPWEQIDRVVGPVPPELVYPEARDRYCRADVPVSREYYRLAEKPGDPRQVLVSGGGWGLGGIRDIAARLSARFPGAVFHVVCGDNRKLYEGLARDTAGRSNVVLYRTLDSLVPLTELCGTVIAKPGALSIAENHAAKRRVFLLRGLPVSEEQNGAYAIRRLGMERFSLKSFAAWMDSCGVRG